MLVGTEVYWVAQGGVGWHRRRAGVGGPPSVGGARRGWRELAGARGNWQEQVGAVGVWQAKLGAGGSQGAAGGPPPEGRWAAPLLFRGIRDQP